VDGTIQTDLTIGPLPTITHPSPGTYEFTISGLGCAPPQVTSFSFEPVVMGLTSIVCIAGSILEVEVVSGNGSTPPGLT
jgi:hypothetical protein